MGFVPTGRKSHPRKAFSQLATATKKERAALRATRRMDVKNAEV
jgi:hypothetical protein